MPLWPFSRRRAARRSVAAPSPPSQQATRAQPGREQLTVPEPLRSLGSEIAGLTRSQDMPHKIALLHDDIRQVEARGDDRILWATLQNSLGIALYENPQGNRAENVEAAIQAYRAALTVYTHETLPFEWAATQNNLGLAYWNRIGGTRAENLELAIPAFEAALTVYKRGAFPKQWAATQINLGLAYWSRIGGNRAENLEQAIQAYRAALTAYTREEFPEQWALTQNNLGTAYRARTGGNRAENVEAAIQAYEAALTVYSREEYPEDWAMAQNNLGAAYWNRIVGSHAENLEKTIAAFEAALTVYTREEYPEDWAMMQNNLGSAYTERIMGNRAENVEVAIQAFEAALEVRTREAFPVKFRDTQVSLAHLYRVAGRWREAHQAYVAARATQRDLVALAPDAESRAATIAQYAGKDIYLRDAQVVLRLPNADLAEVAEILEEGRAQAMRAEMETDTLDLAAIGEPAARLRAERFLQARDDWRAAQRQLTKLPMNTGDAAEKLARRNESRQVLHQAQATFEQARDAIREHDNLDFLAPVVLMSDIARDLATIGVGREEAVVYLAAGQESGLALIVTVNEHGQAVSLHLPLPQMTEAAISHLCETETTVQVETEQGRQEIERITGGLEQAQMGWATSHLRDWGATPSEALAALPPTSGFAQALRKLREMWVADTKQSDKLLAPFEWTFSQLDGAGFVHAFTGQLLRVELQRSLTALGELGVSDLCSELERRNITRVVVIPYGRLALFPLPAVLVGAGKRLSERLEVTLAPSARSYVIARERALRADRERAIQAPGRTRQLMLAVGNPLPLPFGMRSPGVYRGSLAFAAAEADSMHTIASALGYTPDEVVTYIERMATRESVLQSIARSWYAHLAIHGQFDPTRPRNSRLVLAGDAHIPASERALTLGECLDGVISLAGLRLLVLSACETALIDARQSANEVVGLAAGFLQAGAASVIASLWPVNDRATFLLMTRFQQLWLDRERNWSPARCLAEAQHWLREEATNAVIATYQPNQRIAKPATSSDQSEMPEQVSVRSLRKSGAERDSRLTQEHALFQVKLAALEHDNPNDLPYADPIYWAAFSVTGA